MAKISLIWSPWVEYVDMPAGRPDWANFRHLGICLLLGSVDNDKK
jgi:hypothetical protein